jgi:hypothetical protein
MGRIRDRHRVPSVRETLDLGSREFEIRTPEMQSGADCFPRRTQGEQNLPAILPAVVFPANDFQ